MKQHSHSVFVSATLLILFTISILASCAKNHDSGKHEKEEASIANFWTNANVSDTLATERSFVKFISFFPHISQEMREKGVRNFFDTLTDKEMACEIAERYLYNPASPLYNEDYYALFAKDALQNLALSKEEKERLTAQLKVCQTNAPGTLANDFPILLRDNSTTTLRNLCTGPVLLIFYDPDCAHCGETLARLAQDASLNQDISAGKLKVLAIYAEGKQDIWEKTKGSLPKNWTVGYSVDDIQGQELYYLRTMPMFYMLDAGGVVIQKDLPL